MTAGKNISSDFSLFAVIFDFIAIVLPGYGGIWSLIHEDKLLGVIVLAISTTMLVFFVTGTMRLAAVFRDDRDRLMFSYLMLPGKGRISSVVSIKPLVFRKYPRYSVTFLDETGATRELIVIPTLECKDEAEFNGAMKS